MQSQKTSTTPSPHGLSEVNERAVMIAAGLGMFLSTLDTGIINVALPSLGQDFHVSVTVIAWSITLYLITLSTTILFFGRLSDRYGRGRIFTGGLVLFLLGSILCGAAFSTISLIAFRGIQGIGAAMLQATAAALITTLIAPERRGKALGMLGVMIGLGPVLGPVVGGFVLSFLGWRWIFWINIPICLYGFWFCRALLSRDDASKSLSLDLLGNMLLALGLLAFLWSLSQWPVHGLNSIFTLLPFGLAVFCFVALIVQEVRTPHPLLELKHLRRSEVAIPLLAVMAFGAATAIAFIVPPYFLEGVTHLAPWQVGWISLSAPLGLAIMSRLSGSLMRSYSTGVLMEGGLLVMVAALGALSAIQSTWPPLLLASFLFLYGIGGGAFLPANIASIMASVGKELQGTIGATQRMTQNVGIALGTALSAAFIQSFSSTNAAVLTNGFRWSWISALVLLLLCSLGMGGIVWSSYRSKANMGS